jgi:hypothetical protein
MDEKDRELFDAEPDEGDMLPQKRTPSLSMAR